MALTLTSQNFESEVLKSSIPVLVDFWATWCPPCQRLSPVMEELSKEFAGKAKVGKVNVDENGDLATQYGVSNIPAIFIFKEGKIVESITGAQPMSVFANALKKYL